jgi:hypothetical protein
LAVQLWSGGVDRGGGEAAGGVAEEHDEDGRFGQPADPGLVAGDQPAALRAGNGVGASLGGPRAAVRFGDRDTGQLSGDQPRDPPLTQGGRCVVGDEPAVTEPDGVAQVDVAIAAYELGEHGEQRWLVGGGEEAAAGDLVTDEPQRTAAFGTTGQLGADLMPTEQIGEFIL